MPSGRFPRLCGSIPTASNAHLWMARVRLRQRRHVEAAEEALNAVGLEHFCLSAIFSWAWR